MNQQTDPRHNRRLSDFAPVAMDAAKVNAIIATAYNLHFGAKEGGEAMTPAKAAKLKRGDRAALCAALAERGGSDLYTKADALAAFAEAVA